MLRYLMAHTLPLLLALGGLALLAGCGGGGGGSHASLGSPTPDPTKPGSVGGSIFTMVAPPGQSTVIIDQAYNATLTLTRTDGGGSYTAQTHSTIRGGYSFPNVPAGTYTVSATVASGSNSSLILNGQVTGVQATGGVPTLMTNLVMAAGSATAVLTGVVTQSGVPVAGATVSVDMSGYTTEYLQGNTSDTVSVILSTTTGADGRYSFTVPIGGIDYYIAAHNNASMVVENSSPITGLTAGATQEVDIALTPAQTPSFATLTLDIVSTTLPAPTVTASQQAAMTQLAVARALHAPASRLARVQQRVQRTRAGRAVSSLVENDLYWTLASGDVGVRGFHVYRADATSNPYTLIGSSTDPYMFYFYDNDPVLQPGAAHYYTVTSYAANNATSGTATPIAATPLPQITVNSPADGASAPVGSAVVTWTTVPGAQSYQVTKFNAEPTFNALPVGTTVTHGASETSEVISGLSAGDYWWSVSAYNTTDPNFATAAVYSEYRKITLTP